MSDYTVLDERFVFESGMVYLHVVQVGAPVDLAQLICERVPVHCQDFVLENIYQEGKTTIRHHLEMFYPYRGPARISPRNLGMESDVLVDGIFWRRSGQERISVIIQEASELYFGNYDTAPGIAMIQKLPKNAPEQMQLQGRPVTIPIVAASWLPKACVIVANFATWMSEARP